MTPNEKTPKRRSRFIRLVIYTKDLMLLFSMNERTARRRIEEAKKQLGKPKHGFVTIAEFCKCFGLKYEEIIDLLEE